MDTVLLIIMVILILIPISSKAEDIICRQLGKVMKGKLQPHKVLPIITIICGVIMLFIDYSIITKICVLAVMVTKIIELKKY